MYRCFSSMRPGQSALASQEALMASKGPPEISRPPPSGSGRVFSVTGAVLTAPRRFWHAVQEDRFLLLTTIAFLAGISLRLYLAWTQPIYLDEAINYPTSLIFIRTLFSNPLDSSVFAIDITKPQFPKLLFGLAVWGSFGFRNTSPVQTGLIQYLPLSGLFAGRALVIVWNSALTLLAYARVRRKSRAFAFLLVALAFVNPVTAYWTALLEQQAVLFPLSVLFIIYLADSELKPGLALYAAGVFAGLSIASEYYAVVYLVVPLLFYVWLRLAGTSRYKATGFLGFVSAYATFLAFAVVVFYALDPLFWTASLSNISLAVHALGIEQGNTLSNTSGVYGVPTFIGGISRVVTPWYTPLEVILFETPLPILLLACSIPIILLRRGRPLVLGPLGPMLVVALFTMGIELALALPFQHFHDWDYILWFLAPLSVVAAWSGTHLLDTLSSKSRGIDSPMAEHLPAAKDSWRRRTWSPAKRSAYAAVCGALLLALLVSSSAFALAESGAYTNALGYGVGKGGPAFTGAYGSTVADTAVGRYMASHDIVNASVETLALTTSVEFYAPNEHYRQLWEPVTTQELEGSYRQSYVVLDQWYAQRWGTPLSATNANFSLLFSSSNEAGFSQLWHVNSIISEVAPVYASPTAKLYINGSDFGAPALQQIGSSGFDDTLVTNSSGSISLSFENSTGGFLWSAGTATRAGSDGVGILVSVWTNTHIVISGIGPRVVTAGGNVSLGGFYAMAPGDYLEIEVRGPNSSGESQVVVPVRGADWVPEILSASPIAPTQSQDLVINGTGFGQDPSYVVTHSPGFFDTLQSTLSPSLSLSVFYANGTFAWSAGYATAGGGDSVGLNFTLWANDQIVVGGIGIDGSAYSLAAGDLFQLELYGPYLAGVTLWQGTVGA